jgi:hypothetical protein
VGVDVMSGVSLDWITALTWLTAIVTGLPLAFLRPRRLHVAALGSVIAFAVTSAGAGIYVLNHVGDPRWGSEAEDRISAPQLTEAPVIGSYMGPLDDAIRGVADSVNQFVEFQSALPVAMEFFVAAGWALALALPLGLAALIVSYAEAQRRKAEFLKYKLQVDELKGELEDIKRHVGYPAREE